MKPLSLIMADAVVLRGIITLLEEGPATTREIAATQHVGAITAGRCCRALLQAGIVEHASLPRDVLGVVQQIPQLAWQLTVAYQRGEIDFDEEKMAGGL